MSWWLILKINKQHIQKKHVKFALFKCYIHNFNFFIRLRLTFFTSNTCQNWQLTACKSCNVTVATATIEATRCGSKPQNTGIYQWKSHIYCFEFCFVLKIDQNWFHKLSSVKLPSHLWYKHTTIISILYGIITIVFLNYYIQYRLLISNYN